MSNKNMRNNNYMFEEIFGKNSDGILKIDSGKKGKTFTLVACTHGNEPSGLEVIYFLIKKYNIHKKLLSGKIQFIVANIEAMKRDDRFIDTDMNRVFDFSDKNIDTYEFKRAEYISPFLLDSDYVFDLHSSSTPSEPFLIPCRSMDNGCINVLPINYCLKNFIYLFHGDPLIRYVEKEKKHIQACVLEAGSHYDKKTISCSVETVLRGLEYYGFINEEFGHKKKNIDSFEVIESIESQTMKSKILYSENPSNFDKIKEGDCILFDGKNKYYAKHDGYIILPTMNTTYIGEEICFVGK